MTRKDQILKEISIKSKVSNDEKLIALIRVEIDNDYTIYAKSQYFYDLFSRFGVSDESINGYYAHHLPQLDEPENQDLKEYYDNFSRYQDKRLFVDTQNTKPNLSFLRSTKINEGISFKLGSNTIYSKDTLDYFNKATTRIIKDIASKFKTRGNTNIKITSEVSEAIFKWVLNKY